jgi:hypothetical protein
VQEFELTYEVSFDGQPIRGNKALVKAKDQDEAARLLKEFFMKKLSIMIIKREKKNDVK